jgi:acetyltransferase-like isoleucine patch superfamily enzyme
VLYTISKIAVRKLVVLKNIFKIYCVKLILRLPENINYGPIKNIKNYNKKVDSLITVGEGTYGAAHIIKHSWNLDTKIHIGKYCSIADNMHIFLGGNHNMNSVTTFPFSVDSSHDNLFGTNGAQPISNGDIEIGNDVWIGHHVSIMSGVKIGNGSVIAAFSHVVKDVLPYEVIGGNPARHIKFRFSNDVIIQLLEIAWWDWPQDKILKNIALLLSNPSVDTLKFLKNT